MKTFWKIGGMVLDVCGVLFILSLFIFLNPKIFKPIVVHMVAAAPLPTPTKVIYSQIPKSEFTSSFIDSLQSLQLKVGDSLNKVDGLKTEGLLKSGIIWLGVSGYSDSVFAIFDFYRDCGCGPGVVDLIRLVPINREFTLKELARKKMSWDTYFLYATESKDTIKSRAF